MATNNIVLIHGLWMTPLSFEYWAHYYSEQGYNVRVPAWPGMERDIRVLRRSPESYAALDIRRIVEHYERIVLDHDEPPIIIGHGVGGLVAQMLLGRGLGSCGVAVASAPIRGIWTLPYTKMRMVTPQFFDPRRAQRCIALSATQFHHAFMNTASREEAQWTWQRYAVPAPRRVMVQVELANFNPFSDTAVNVWRNNRAPLLMISASQDRIAPPSMVQANVRAYRESLATTEYREFPGHTHFVMAQSGWQEVARYVLEWVQDQEMLLSRETRRVVREIRARQVA